MRTAAKVLIVTNMVTPYRIPVFNALADCQRYDFKVCFLTTREANREWSVRTKDLSIPYEIMSGWHKFLWRFDLSLQFNPGIWSFLFRESPDVIVVGGYMYPACWLAWLYAKVFQRKLIMWSGSTLQSVRMQNPAVHLLRSWFIRQMNAFVCYSTGAARFIEAHGGDQSASFVGYNVGETDYFSVAAMSLDSYRRRHSDGQVTILYVGQLILRKGLHLAIQALAKLDDRKWTLTIIGSGPEQDRLSELSKVAGIEGSIKFLGFQTREELTYRYAEADLFLFPSVREVAGIVVSEALASGVFTLASKYDGIAPDLVRSGYNGYLIDPLDCEQMTTTIQKAIEDVRMGRLNREQIRQSIAEFTPTRYAGAFVQAVDYVFRKQFPSC